MKSICETLGHMGKIKRVKGFDFDTWVCDCQGKKSFLWKYGVDIEIKGTDTCGCGKKYQHKPITYRVIDCPMCKQRIKL